MESRVCWGSRHSFVREIAPAVQEIEEKIRDNRFLAELLPRMTRPQD